MTLLKLRDLGHPDYMKKEEKISCSNELELAESMVTTYNNYCVFEVYNLFLLDTYVRFLMQKRH